MPCATHATAPAAKRIEYIYNSKRMKKEQFVSTRISPGQRITGKLYVTGKVITGIGGTFCVLIMPGVLARYDLFG